MLPLLKMMIYEKVAPDTQFKNFLFHGQVTFLS